MIRSLSCRVPLGVHHDRCHVLDDLAPAAALGALDPHEATRARLHLGACTRTHHGLRELVALAAAIGWAVPDVAVPSPDLRDRVLIALNDESDGPGPSARPVGG
jgi:hypothetical protein